MGSVCISLLPPNSPHARIAGETSVALKRSTTARVFITPCYSCITDFQVLVAAMTWNSSQKQSLHPPQPVASQAPQAPQQHIIHNMHLDKVESLVSRFLAPGDSELSDYFHPAGEEHLPQILAMRQRMVERSTAEDEAYLRWRYNWSLDGDNRALGRNHIRIFCKDDEVLGFVGIEAATLSLHGREAQAIKVMDLMVKPEVDRRGLGVWMNLKLQSAGLPMIALGSNRNSLGIMSKLFYRLPNQQVYRGLLNGSNYLSSRIGNRILAGMFSGLYNLGVPLLLASRQIKAGGHGIVLRNLTRFDAAHDGDLAQMQSEGICFRRTAGYLNWRFFDIPTDRVEVLGLWEEQQLVGYLALALRPAPGAAGSMSVFLLDWGSRRGKPYQQALVAALLDCQRRLRREGVESVTAFASSSDQDKLLRRACLHRRKDDRKTVSIFVKDPFSFQALCQGSEWTLTGADTDYA